MQYLINCKKSQVQSWWLAKEGDVIGCIQPRFVYQSAFPDYYELVEDWEVEENTNIDVVKETKENYPRSSEYAEAMVNVLDEVP